MQEALRDLQKAMPWTDLWTEAFKTDRSGYGPYQHCLINVAAKNGSLLQRVEMSDHYGPDYTLGLNRAKDGRDLAFIVMSALKAANVYPGGSIDLSELICGDLARRNREN